MIDKLVCISDSGINLLCLSPSALDEFLCDENMIDLSSELDFSNAVPYHYGKFPPKHIDYGALIRPLSSASAALARYDQMLKGMHNSELLLAPLRRQEAVVSSRIEGTITTLDEVLRYEADQDDDEKHDISGHRNEAMEVFLYHQAMKRAQSAMEEGAEISDHLIRSLHSILLGYGRGADKAPGAYKDEQNYVVDKNRKSVQFIPISPEQLPGGMANLHSFIASEDYEKHMKTAIAHIEFEALHPFKDGNGRIGRILITLMLWKYGIISAPHFYISSYLEKQRDEYVERLREVSRADAWTEWCVFFLNALEKQAFENIRITNNIGRLYDDMKDVFRDTLSSQWTMTALDFIFSQPVFRNNRFTHKSGIPRPTAARFSRALLERGLLTVLEPAAGRRPALFAFEPLLRLVRG